MLFQKNIATILSALFIALSMAHSQAFAAAGMRVDDAEAKSRGDCELESWLATTGKSHEIMLMPSCGVGAATELSVGYERLVPRRDSNSNSLIFQSKTQLSSEDQPLQFALSIGSVLDLTRRDNDPRISDVFINLPITFELQPHTELRLNAGLLRDRAEQNTLGTGGVALVQSLNPNIDVFAEAFRIDDSGRGWQAGFILPDIGNSMKLDLSILNSRPDDRRRFSLLLAVSFSSENLF
ncbi:hypothetical protein MPL1_04247 [Methylophaga lonarensis MPL]|uniref:Transporter n=1 Tax=Methylophaga lonarensis MPL TaxID=1286106 RepID=M7NXQ8_9GAMM|nr:hypothetical protein [Methylophaga lonarensis]EMR13578.1 hypothetical protein MPL1_04247 [Methylophaga lonarensis MPL]